MGTHSVPAGFDLDVCAMAHELLTSFAMWKEREEDCDHGVSVDVAHCEGIVEEMRTEVI